MELRPSRHSGTVLIPSAEWDRIQAKLSTVVERCVSLVSAIENHQINGEYEAEELLDRIDGQVRVIRKLIEQLTAPF